MDRVLDTQKDMSMKEAGNYSLSELGFTLGARKRVRLKKDPKNKITIVGSKQAREGFTFIHRGPAEKCVECEFRKVCSENLEVNRVYEVVGVRKRQLFCTIHEDGARVVEVREAPVRTTIPIREAFEGATSTWKLGGCERGDCENYDLCHPLGLEPGDRCKVVEVVGRMDCPSDASSPLAIVLLHRMVE